jgi:hypothetical protein
MAENLKEQDPEGQAEYWEARGLISTGSNLTHIMIQAINVSESTFKSWFLLISNTVWYSTVQGNNRDIAAFIIGEISAYPLSFSALAKVG